MRPDCGFDQIAISVWEPEQTIQVFHVYDDAEEGTMVTFINDVDDERIRLPMEVMWDVCKMVRQDGDDYWLDVPDWPITSSKPYS